MSRFGYGWFSMYIEIDTAGIQFLLHFNSDIVIDCFYQDAAALVFLSVGVLVYVIVIMKEVLCYIYFN